MSEKKCLLCEGNVVNGRCRECGMNYSREKVYRLNGEPRTARSSADQAENRVNPYAAARGAQKTSRQTTSAQAGRTAQKRAENWHPTLLNGKKARKKRKRGSLTSIVIALIVVMGVLSSAFEWFYNTLSDLGRNGSEEISTEDSSYVEYEYDPYAYVTEELSEEGDYVTQILQPGTYVGGSHLPEGRYEIKAAEGYGSIVLEDAGHTPYRWEYLTAEPTDEDEETSAGDFRLFTGWTLRVLPGVIIEVSSDNAQTDVQSQPEQNPLDTAVRIQDGMIAGLDFPVGAYDMKAVSKYGSVVIRRGEQELLNTFLEADTLSDSYRNLILETNDEIIMEKEYSAEDFEVRLEPSAEIYPE